MADPLDDPLTDWLASLIQEIEEALAKGVQDQIDAAVAAAIATEDDRIKSLVLAWLVGLPGSFGDWWQTQVVPSSHQADHAVLTILKGDKMPTVITIDTTGAVASLSFVDRLGEATAAPLSSDGSTPVVVAYTSDTPAVATVDPTTGALTEVAAGTVNIGATVNDGVTGSPVLEPDGVTPFAPAPINVTVNPGAAVGDVFTVNVPS